MPFFKLNPTTANDIKRHAFSTVCSNLAALKRSISIWAERSRQRRALAQLSAYQLKDIGVSRGDAINEVGKPFWKP